MRSRKAVNSSTGNVPGAKVIETGPSIERHLDKVEVVGSNPIRCDQIQMTKSQFKQFEFRWNEALGRPECPFLIRWVVTMFGWSVRLHHWLSSDDDRFFHDHGWDFWVMILWGGYWEIQPSPSGDRMADWRQPFTIRFYKAEHKHIVQIPKGKRAWSLVISKPLRRNFGYWVGGRSKVMRHLRYFSRYGLHPCE